MRILFAGLALSITMLAGAAVAAPIDINDAYARATPPGAPVGAVYFELRNQDTANDRLLSAESPVAERTEVHTHTMEDGVARMHEVPAVELPPGATVAFQPGGYHIMLIELKAALVEGETLPLTLVFERAGEVSLTVPIKKVTTLKGQDRHHHQHRQHHHQHRRHHQR